MESPTLIRQRFSRVAFEHMSIMCALSCNHPCKKGEEKGTKLSSLLSVMWSKSALFEGKVPALAWGWWINSRIRKAVLYGKNRAD